MLQAQARARKLKEPSSTFTSRSSKKGSAQHITSQRHPALLAGGLCGLAMGRVGLLKLVTPHGPGVCAQVRLLRAEQHMGDRHQHSWLTPGDSSAVAERTRQT